MDIETIAVIGAGELGRGITCAALLAGYRTILEDVSESRLGQAVVWMVSIGHVGDESRSRLVLASAVEEAVRAADLIVEAVADEMEMKIEMFTIFDKFAKPGAIFASTSSSLSITELAAVTFCPERCIGMRSASAPQQGNGLELVCTPDTSDTTMAACREVGRRMGREISVVRDTELRRQDAPRGSGQASATQPAVEISAKGSIPA